MATIKTFEDHYEPIEMTVKNIKGEEFLITSKFLSIDEFEKIEDLLKDPNLKESEKMRKMMVIKYGKNEAFWGQFSQKNLTKVNEYVAEQESKKNSE